MPVVKLLANAQTNPTERKLFLNVLIYYFCSNYLINC